MSIPFLKVHLHFLFYTGYSPGNQGKFRGGGVMKGQEKVKEIHEKLPKSWKSKGI